VRLVLWDEGGRRLISFRDMRRRCSLAFTVLEVSGHSGHGAVTSHFHAFSQVKRGTHIFQTVPGDAIKPRAV